MYFSFFFFYGGIQGGNDCARSNGRILRRTKFKWNNFTYVPYVHIVILFSNFRHALVSSPMMRAKLFKIGHFQRAWHAPRTQLLRCSSNGCTGSRQRPSAFTRDPCTIDATILDEATRREFNESRSFVKDKARQPLQRGAFIRAFLSGFLLFCSTIPHPLDPLWYCLPLQHFFLRDLLFLPFVFFLSTFEANDIFKGKKETGEFDFGRYYLRVIANNLKITSGYVF